MLELLAPAGDFNKLKTALHFGADAVYVGGNNYGLRANAKNFTNEGLREAVEYTHKLLKKIYVTCNIVAHNEDFYGLNDYLQYVEDIGVDAIIVSDPGIICIAKEILKNTKIHLSTQSNCTNKYTAKFWAENGVSRIVLARELSLKEIFEIKQELPKDIELEAFVHGAMCISHSGRCLLSNFLTKRDGNRGECVQACRWEYEIHEVSRKDNSMTISEDGRGTYIMNSKDLNMVRYVEELFEAGITSFKIEGRIKSQYYVGTVTNAYRLAIDAFFNGQKAESIEDELFKTAHRAYTTGFYFGEYDSVNLKSSQATCDYDFIAEILSYDDKMGGIIVEQRNRFKIGDKLEILSNNINFLNKDLIVTNILDLKGNKVDDAKLVQQHLFIPCEYKLTPMDILRKKGGEVC